MANEVDKKLDKKIIIGEDSFILTAETPNSLTINRVCLNQTTKPVVNFNGKESAHLDLVTADGGRFKQRIAVPPDTRDTIDDEAVLNYGDIRNKVLNNLLNTSVLYSWNGTKLDPTINNAIVGISLITGSESNLLDPQKGFAVKNKNSSKKVSAYLYICTDTNNIYFGTSDENTARRLATEATELSLTKPISLNVDLESEDAAELDGSTEGASLGVTGKLPMSHGGLGGNLSTDTQVATATEYYVNGSITEDRTAVSDTTWMLFSRDDPSESTGQYCRKRANSLWVYLVNKIRTRFGFSTTDGTDVLSPAHGGTGEKNLRNVTVGNSNMLNNQSADYYQKKITVSNSEPSGGSVGDIWIVYK